MGIVFKGSGFYATDHHSPSGQSPKKDEKESKESPDSKGTDAKVEKNGSGESKVPEAKGNKSSGEKE